MRISSLAPPLAAGLGLSVAAMAAFPHARRRRFGIPLEIAVLVVAFIESAIGTPDNVLRIIGIISAVCGLILIWAIRR